MDATSYGQLSRSSWVGLFFAVWFSLLFCTDVGHGLAQEEAAARKSLSEIIARDVVVARGKESFIRNCASCHGTQAIGDGPVADTLKVEPANLTQLSQKEGGEFPFWQVYRSVDGRLELPGHGTREMPIWGFVFRKSHFDTETQVRDRILDLVYYIESVQAE